MHCIQRVKPRKHTRVIGVDLDCRVFSSFLFNSFCLSQKHIKQLAVAAEPKLMHSGGPFPLPLEVC